MDKKIEECRTSDLDEFFGSLREGKPIAIYDGFLCGCRSGIRGRRREYEELLEDSKTKMVVGLDCDEDYEIKRVRKMGKTFVRSVAETVDEIVDKLTKDHQRELACKIFKDIFGYSYGISYDSFGELRGDDPFVEMFFEYPKREEGISDSEHDLLVKHFGKDYTKKEEVDYHSLLDSVDKAFSEGRIMLLDELSWYFRKGKGEDRKIYLSTSHDRVTGGYVLKGDKVEGKACSKHGFTFSCFDEELKKSIKEHGFDVERMAYRIEGKVDPKYAETGLESTVYTLPDDTEFSLHGDVKKTKEYYESIKGRIKEALGIREHYKKLVEGLLAES